MSFRQQPAMPGYNILISMVKAFYIMLAAREQRGYVWFACDFAEKMELIQKSVTLPVVTGFGISTNDTAKEVFGNTLMVL